MVNTISSFRSIGDTPFARLFASTMLERGIDERWLAEQLDVNHDAVRKWRTGFNRPAIQRLPEIARLLDLELEVVCEAAGKPIVEVLRAAFAASPETSLPGMVRAWRESQRIDNFQAAERIGMNRNDFARIQCGSTQPGREWLLRLVTALPYTLVELTDAAWPGDDEYNADMRRWARCYTRPTAVLIRQARVQAGVDLDMVAVTSSLSPVKLNEFEQGREVPDVDECIALARGLSMDLLALLLAAGYDMSLATAVTAAAKAASRRRKGRGRELVAKLRERPYVDTGNRARPAIAWEEISRRTGIGRFRVMKVVNGTHTNGFTAEECLLIADALDAPADRLLAGFGHHL